MLDRLEKGIQYFKAFKKHSVDDTSAPLKFFLPQWNKDELQLLAQ